jgi:CHASE2 domain-containing sensor protein
MKKCILNLKKGIVYTSVAVQLWDETGRLLWKRESYLPDNRELESFYQEWRSLYNAYYLDFNYPVRMEIEENSLNVLRFSKNDFKQTCKQLKKQLNRWLNNEPFSEIEQQLRIHLQPSDEIQIVIETEDEQMRRLPWHLWQFFRDYPQAEIVLSLPEYERISPPTKKATGDVKILGILGNCKTIDGEKIDIQTDRRLIEQLPGAKARFLVEPSREALDAQLWEQNWDIFFFAGHSNSASQNNSATGERGRIYINQSSQDDSLSASELENALLEATKRGLYLAIFNSCDSLGLAWDLAQLNLPQIIAMREVVPDEVAQTFLRYFLKAFAGGKSFYLSVREARERLQGLEDKFPCASWLPVICQNPTVEAPTWKQLRGTKPRSQLWHNCQKVLLTSLAVTGAVVGARSLGLLQAWELQAYDRLMQLRPPEQSDERFLVVTVGEQDIQYQDRSGMERKGSLSDSALELLLQKIEPYHPRIIALDIYHDFDFQTSLAEQLDNKENFIAACEIGQTEDNPLTIASPPGFGPERIGFTDFPRDPDDVMRRQLLLMTSTPSCAATHSLSLRTALAYLAKKGITLEKTPQKELQFDNVVLKRFTHDAGGYQLSSADALGYQILTNYRAASFAQVSLRDILSNAIAMQIPDLVKDRIILIGVTKNSQDVHLTPYSQGAWVQKMPGVFLQAHLMSQIVSAVEDKRPLIWWWSQPLEIFWIGVWSFAAGILSLLIRRFLSLGLALGSMLAFLSGCCFLLLLQGGWVPLVPVAIAAIATCVIVWVWRSKQR